jgi:Flp pilus assembly protein TadD
MNGFLDGRAREALYAFGFAMLESERLDDAVKAFRVFVRFAPTDERAWLGLGACHERLDQPDIAAELYGAGTVTATPPSARCHLALARIMRDQGDRSAAREHVDQAEALLGNDAELSVILEGERRRACTP